jgi:tRNA(Ile)-lysidine synthase
MPRPPSSRKRPRRVRSRANSSKLSLELQFSDAMSATGTPWPAAVAVSGGSDSVALMLLLRDWARINEQPSPYVVCVDHGLRPGSNTEAQQVLRWAKAVDLRAQVLTYKGKLPRSDIEAAARLIRYKLLGMWARKKGLKGVYVAHTRDDQAETFLLRLARGSGVDGLSAMRDVAPYPDNDFPGLALVRPLLSFDRCALRAYLRARHQPWLEDPMNNDQRFARARIRAVWPTLEKVGLTKARIADAATHLGRARVALDAASKAVLTRACLPGGGGILVDPKALTAAPRELGLRSLAHILMVVSQRPYRPRFERLENLYSSVLTGSLGAGRTLHGCMIAPAPSLRAVFGGRTLLIRREERRRKG